MNGLPQCPLTTHLQTYRKLKSCAIFCTSMALLADNFSERAMSGSIGFALIAASICGMATIQFFSMPIVVDGIEGLPPTQEQLAVETLRTDWLILHSWAIAIVAAYWLLITIFAGGQHLRIRSANIALGLCLIAYFALSIFGSIIPNHIAMEILCPALGISDVVANPFGFDARSPCQAFAFTAYQLTLLGLMSAAFLLLLVSLALRILSSRRSKVL